MSDPVASLVEALAPRSEERELVRLAVTLLVRERFLETDASSIWIPELPASQAARWASSDLELPHESARAPSSSTERVRRHRANKRAAVSDPSASRAAAVSELVTSAVSPAVSGVTSPVSCNVSSSRGDRDPDPSQSLNREKYKRTDHHLLPRGREATSVSSVTASVSSGVSRSVSPARVSSSKEEDEDEQRNLNFRGEGTPTLELPIQERAALVLEKPHLARSLHPERWPEVQSIAAALAEATGVANGYLGGYDDDPGVQAVLKLYGAGIPQPALEYVARTVPRQAWWAANGKKLGLSSLSLEVVRRNLPGADGRARVTSPGVAKALELLRRDVEAANE